MSELDPLLQVELLKWRASVDAAKRDDPSRLDHVQSKRLRAYITTKLNDDALAALGVAVSSRSRERVIGEFRLEDAERIARAPGVERVTPEQPMMPELDGSVPQIGAPAVWNATPGFKGRNVVVGVIDSGIDIFHDSFRKADRTKSRILFIWDQRAPGTGPPDGIFNYGVEYTQAQIEAALAIDVADPGTATFPHTDGSGTGAKRTELDGHGTHVASIAAGDGSPIDTCDWPFTFVGIAPEADIIVVATRWTDTSHSEALEYIFNRAGTKPAVVNMSFGDNAGPHDGTHQLERDIDNLLTNAAGNPLPGRAVVKSAGNEGEWRRHARKRVTSNGSVTFTFDLEATESLPSNKSSDRIDVWFDGTAMLQLTVTGPPTGNPATDFRVFPLAGGLLAVSGTNVTVSAAVLEPNGRRHISIQIAANPPATLGQWKLTFQEQGLGDADIDIWANRQNEDVCPRFVPADAVRENTISTPGNAWNVITVGNYDPDRGIRGLFGGDYHLADSSSWGAPIGWLPPGRRLKPDIAAPGQNIMAARSGKSRHKPPCCRCCNYLHVDMSGTSMAAPHVTGAIALMFERDPTLNFERVRSILQLTADHDHIDSNDAPVVLPLDRGGGGLGSPGDPDFLEIRQNHIWGSGRLNVKRAVETIVRVAVPSGGGGGGGGGGTIELADSPWEGQLAGLQSALGPVLFNHPAVQLIAALVSTHIDEVRRLVDSNKRVATAWHRGGGANALRQFAKRWDAQSALPVASLLQGLIGQLAKFGSAELKSDLDHWRDFLIAAPGSDLESLDARVARLVG